MYKFVFRLIVVAAIVVAVGLGAVSSAFADDAPAASPPAPPSGDAAGPTTAAPVVAVMVPVVAASNATPPAPTSQPASTPSSVHAADVQTASVLPPIVVDPKLGAPQPPPEASGPAGRIGSGFAATPDGTQAVLYGGGDVFGGGTALGDTWVWNGTTWTPKCGTTTPGATAACAPGARDLVGEATGPTGVVLYGGQTGDGSGNQTTHDDSYLWNGTTWQTICTHCAPGTRAAPAMAGNGVIVLLFGGGDTGGNGPGVALGDTWQFNGTTWTQVNAGGAGQPVGRLGGSMAWDGHQFVLFGGLVPGNNSQTTLADTWIWTGAQWVQACGTPLAACGPAPRVLGGFANLASPDPAQQGALLVGGLGLAGNNQPPNILGDIWFWNGTNWLKQASPWPDSTSLDNGFPNGLPLVGALAALPATCQVTLAGDFATGSDGTRTATPGTWNIGFDTNNDAKPDPCPPTPLTVSPVAAATAAPTGGLPMTGSDLARDALAGTLTLAVGLILTITTRRRTCTS